MSTGTQYSDLWWKLSRHTNARKPDTFESSVFMRLHAWCDLLYTLHIYFTPCNLSWICEFSEGSVSDHLSDINSDLQFTVSHFMAVQTSVCCWCLFHSGFGSLSVGIVLVLRFTLAWQRLGSNISHCRKMRLYPFGKKDTLQVYFLFLSGSTAGKTQLQFVHLACASACLWSFVSLSSSSLKLLAIY